MDCIQMQEHLDRESGVRWAICTLARMLASGFCLRALAGRTRAGISSLAFLQTAPGVNGRQRPDRGAFPL